MALAVVGDEPTLESPWPRPALRLVQPLPAADRAAPIAPPGAGLEEDVLSWDVVGPAPAMVPRRTAEPLTSVRGARRPAPGVRPPAGTLVARRRRTALGVLAVGLLLALAAPVSALAGKPVEANRSTAPPSRAQAVVYTVRPGDSLRSIAARLSPGPASRSLAAALAAELGTDQVVPGERLVLP